MVVWSWMKTALSKQPFRSLCDMAKKKHQKSFNLYDELKPILDEYSNEIWELKEQALDKASDYMVEQLALASPEDTGTLKKGWSRTHKYKGVRYIGNSAVTRTVNKYGYHIPLTNILEYSSKGKPFIRKTFEENKEQIVNIIKETIENGNTQ